MSNYSKLVDNVTAIPGISDHDSIAQIEFTTKAKINKKKPHKIYKFHQADFKQITRRKCVNSLNNISIEESEQEYHPWELE